MELGREGRREREQQKKTFSCQQFIFPFGKHRFANIHHTSRIIIHLIFYKSTTTGHQCTESRQSSQQTEAVSNQSKYMIELRHMDKRHFVIIEGSHLVNGCPIKCACTGLMLFRYQSCLGTIICDINTIESVSLYMHAKIVTLWWQVVQPLTRHP